MDFREREISLHGVAEAWRPMFTRIAVAGAIGVGALSLAGCGEEDHGVVVTGANGQHYVLPEGAQRPVYKNEADCEADVKAQIKTIEDNDGDNITEKPADLCESVSSYAGHTAVVYPGTYYYGPVVSGDSAWASKRPVVWENGIKSGTIAAPGHSLQKGITVAPRGAVEGARTTIRGGFGASAKGGFARGAGS